MSYSKSAASEETIILCRFCAQLKRDDDQIVKLNENSEARNTCLRIGKFFKNDFLDVSEDDELPKSICGPCYSTMMQGYSFFKMIARSFATTLKAECSDDSTPIQQEDVKFEGVQVEDCKNIESKFKREVKTDILVSETPSASEYRDTVDQKYAGHYVHDKHDMTWSCYTWKCSLCYQRFDTLSQLRSHSIEKHNTCGMLRCDDCDEKHQTFEEFIEHVRGHRDNLRHFCKHCDYYCKSKKECIKHEENHKLYMFYCDVCGEQFLDALALTQHKKRNLQINKTHNCSQDSDDSLSSVTFDKPLETVGFKIPAPDVIITSWTDYPWICRPCQTAFTTLDKCREHTKTEHNKCAVFSCFDCKEYQPKKFRHFISHIQQHRPNLSFQCYICYTTKRKADSLLKHMVGHFRNCVFCDKCGERFACKDSLSEHSHKYRQIRRTKRYTSEDLTCKVCNKTYKHRQSFRCHELTHVSRKLNFACDKCGKTFNSRSSFQSHMQRYERKYECDLCGSRFSQKVHLIRHINTHTDIKPYCCDECGYKCRDVFRLRQHKIKHTSHAPFVCNICNRVFKTALYLKKHGVQHTGEKPYNCRFCNISFASSANCHTHMKRIHGALLRENNTKHVF